MDSKKLSEYALIFMGVVLIVFLLKMFSTFLRPLAIAIILSFLFTPLIRLSKKNRRKQIAKIGFYAVALIGLIIGLGVIVFQAVTSIDPESVPANTSLIEGLSFKVGNTNIALTQFIDIEKITSAVSSIMGTFVSSLTSFVRELFLIILFLIFLLPIENLWIRSMRRRMNEQHQEQFMKTLNDMEDGVRGYLKVKTVISIGTAAVSLIIMWLFGVEYALLFTIAIFGLNYIPNIGSTIAVVVVVLVQAFSWGISWKLGVLGLLLIAVQMVFGNYLDPKLSGKTLDINPLNVLIGLLFWGAIWGIGGMLFSVPLTLAIKIFLKHTAATKDLAEYI